MYKVKGESENEEFKMNYEPRARRTKHQADRRDAASLRVTQKLKLNFTREKSRIAVQWGQDDQY